MTREKLMPSVVLGVICIAVATLLAVINIFTGPRIEANNNAAANSALVEVLPNGKNFKELTLTDEYPEVITAAWSADGGFVFKALVKGKADLTVMCGVDAEGKIVAAKSILPEETPDYAIKVFPHVEGENSVYTGMNYDSYEPYLVAGATLTSQGFADAIKASLQSFIIANGGDVETRTPEQILQDNCNLALGTEDKVFEKWFALETIEGVDAIYETDGGRVYVFGESFVGIKADGSVATADATAENKEKALSADAIISAITLTDVEKPEGAKKQVVSIKLASNGTYVFELAGYGYDTEFEYSDGNMEGNPKPISIRLSISADGKIIDCRTLDHAETEGLGSVCETEEYTSQFKDKTAGDIVISSGYPMHNDQDEIKADCTDLGAIASATFTTYGYQNALKAAFDAFELINSTAGGNE